MGWDYKYSLKRTKCKIFTREYIKSEKNVSYFFGKSGGGSPVSPTFLLMNPRAPRKLVASIST